MTHQALQAKLNSLLVTVNYSEADRAQYVERSSEALSDAIALGFDARNLHTAAHTTQSQNAMLRWSKQADSDNLTNPANATDLMAVLKVLVEAKAIPVDTAFDMGYSVGISRGDYMAEEQINDLLRQVKSVWNTPIGSEATNPVSWIMATAFVAEIRGEVMDDGSTPMFDDLKNENHWSREA